MISSLALFVALGGASYAALGANSIGSKQLKKNAVVTPKIKNKAVTTAKLRSGAVTTAKLKNNAVTTAKVRNESITGAKVNESTLGEVPNAGHANLADVATTSQSVAGFQAIGLRKLQPSAENPSYPDALAAATEVPLLDLGSISVYAKCFMTGVSLYASHFIRTDTDGAIFDAYFDYAYGVPTFLDADTPEDEREIYTVSIGPDYASIATNPDPTRVVTASGDSFLIDTWVAAKSGNLPEGDGAYGPGNVCVYAGYAQKT